MGEIMRRPIAVVESPFHKFVLFDAPDETTLPGYIEELRRFEVTHVVRTCEPTYSVEPMNKAGIEVHDLCFVDGGVPPPDIIDKWLAILHSTATKEPDKSGKKIAIGVHCVAGLGRTPVMVAIALIESGTNALDAVAMIRKQRKGAVNKPQLEFLQKYKKRSKKKGCIVM